jgi:hypothetical protein
MAGWIIGKFGFDSRQERIFSLVTNCLNKTTSCLVVNGKFIAEGSAGR